MQTGSTHGWGVLTLENEGLPRAAVALALAAARNRPVRLLGPYIKTRFMSNMSRPARGLMLPRDGIAD